MFRLSKMDCRAISTPRIVMQVRQSGLMDGVPVLMVHGNLSSSVYYEPLMSAVSKQYRCIAPDLRGFGDTADGPIDATRGVSDWSDDLAALLETLDIDRCHLVGWSLGGAIAMQLAIDHAPRIASMALIAPISPFGFGGTVDERGTLAFEDHSASGAGLVVPEVVDTILARDSHEAHASLASLIKDFFVHEDSAIGNLDPLVEATRQQRIGDFHYPGDIVLSDNGPGFAPGAWGVMNAISPRYLNLAGVVDIEKKPPVLWLRGDKDIVVSNQSAVDYTLACANASTELENGVENLAPQPMLDQIRYVLDQYKSNDGVYSETIMANTGHGPMIEDPQTTAQLLENFFSNVPFEEQCGSGCTGRA